MTTADEKRGNSEHGRRSVSRSLKAALKAVPGVDGAVGLVRYLQYRKALRQAVASEPAASGLPPPHLRYRVHRSFDIAEYEGTGRDVASSISQAFVAAGAALDGRDVLDLGSGPGRVARWLKRLHPSMRLTCVDIDDEAVSWGQQHADDIARFMRGDAHPPSAFASGSFDAVYCISLFTHLDEPMQDAWLAEIRRLLRPGGLLLATTHGEFATGSCSEDELKSLQRDGIVFRTTGRRRIKLDGLPGFYQTTFHTRDYVEAHWSKSLQVVAYLPGGIQQHQDIVVLRRPPN